MDYGLGFRVQGPRFRVLGFRNQDVTLRAWGFEA